MAYTVIIHLPNEDPFVAEIEELPKPTDNFVRLTNPRKRDGSQMTNFHAEAESFIYPWHRVTFIEVLPSEAERIEIVKFFRE